MSNVFNLDGTPHQPAQKDKDRPNEKVIAVLEELLKEARNGEIQGLAYAKMDVVHDAYWGTIEAGGPSVIGALDCARQYLSADEVSKQTGRPAS